MQRSKLELDRHSKGAELGHSSRFEGGLFRTKTCFPNDCRPIAALSRSQESLHPKQVWASGGLPLAPLQDTQPLPRRQRLLPATTATLPVAPDRLQTSDRFDLTSRSTRFLCGLRAARLTRRLAKVPDQDLACGASGGGGNDLRKGNFHAGDGEGGYLLLLNQ